MAAFSYQHSPLVLESFLVPNKLSSLLEDNNTTFLSPLCPGNNILLPPQFHEITSSLHTTTCVNVKHITATKDSSSMVANEQLQCGGHDQLTPLVRNREKMKDFSKVAREGKVRKQNISNAMLKSRKQNKSKNKVIEDSPTGYIHVRARRGQATDSHSLAERVRRQKISERMRLLQSIVPGCDKITGKAHILDEIINYVQSLQNQAAFLVEKLASVSPMLNDFDTITLLSEELCSLEPPMPSVLQSSSIQFSPLAEPRPNLQQKSNLTSQDNGIPLWEVNEQRLKFVNQDAQFNNLSPFF